EILDFCSDLAGKTGAIKMRNTGYAAFCGEQIAPDLFCSVPNRADQADASDYNATSQLLPAFRVLPDVVNGILHSANLLRIFVGDFDLKSFFEGHYQLYGVQRIGAQVVHERGVWRDFAFVNSQLFYDELLYFFINGCHVLSSLTVCMRAQSHATNRPRQRPPSLTARA